jgi:hypothetical protein
LLLQATTLLDWIPEARSRNLLPEITVARDFDQAIEAKAAAVGHRTRELRKCAPAADPRYGNTQGALC